MCTEEEEGNGRRTMDDMNIVFTVVSNAAEREDRSKTGFSFNYDFLNASYAYFFLAR